MQETQKTWVHSLGQKDPLEEEMATHSSILVRKNPTDRGAWQATVHGLQSWTRVRLFQERLNNSLYSLLPENNSSQKTFCLELRHITENRLLDNSWKFPFKFFWLNQYLFFLYSNYSCWVSSVQSLSRVQLLWLHELQHARPPCPSPTSGVHSDSHPLSQWCHPAISSSVVAFSSCPQSLPASESFPMSQLFSWGGQSTGVSALASFLPKKTQGWSPLEWTGRICLLTYKQLGFLPVFLWFDRSSLLSTE